MDLEQSKDTLSAIVTLCSLIKGIRIKLEKRKRKYFWHNLIVSNN